jgi:hypothetical protein
MNDLMGYLTYIGRWKELTPPDVVATKRDADRPFYSIAPLFSESAVEAYQGFLDQCFNIGDIRRTDDGAVLQVHGKGDKDRRIRSSGLL